MKFREGEDVVIVRNLGERSNFGKNSYYYGGTLRIVPLNTKGKIFRIEGNKIRVQLNGIGWLGEGYHGIYVHPDELDFLDKEQMAKLRRILPGMKDLPRHPVFEIAEQAPVFLVDDKVYSLGEGTPQDGDNFYWQKKSNRLTRTPLIEVGDFGSLEALVLDRAQPDIEKIGEAYAKEAQRDLNVLKGLDGFLDTPQLIYKLVFPYLQDGHYKDKVSELLGAEKNKDVVPIPQKKTEVKQRLEQIADKIEIEVKSLIEQIEEDRKESIKRTKKQSNLDDLFGYEEPKPCTGDSLLERALNGRNAAIVEGVVYELVAESDSYKKHVQIGGKRFSLVKREEPKREPKTDFEVGDKIRMNSKANENGNYTMTKEGSEGEITSAGGAGVYFIKFTKITGMRPHDVPVSFPILEDYMENISKVVVRNGATAGNLEDRFLAELGKKVRVDALREHLSRDKIIDLLRTKDAELLAMAGRKEYLGEGFGFTQDETGEYYAYIDFPAIAIKSEEDGNYYFYDRTKIALRVSKNLGDLDWGGTFYMVDNNGHPYVHNQQRKRFAEICQGEAINVMPTSGRDMGEVIAKRLRKMKEVLMFGYTWKFFDPVHEGINYNKDTQKYRRKLSELQEMNIPIIVKEELIK
ncbi:hypothetical protein HYT23_04880 [Candidatus Pacearchaeota archaeon]|nr:hypothetical protein [Candidatus Pacearchaeota archaeon]